MPISILKPDRAIKKTLAVKRELLPQLENQGGLSKRRYGTAPTALKMEEKAKLPAFSQQKNEDIRSLRGHYRD